MSTGVMFLLAALVTGALVASVVALAREVYGIAPNPTRPPSWPQRIGRTLKSPGTGRRVGAAVLAGTGVLVLTRWPVAALGLAALVALWPKLFGGRRAEEQQTGRLEALVVFTESLRDTIAAHAGLEQAIPAAAANAPTVLRPALVQLIGQIRARVPMDKALLGLAAELDDPSADTVIAALMLNVRRRGDRLGDVLTGLATTAREELEMRSRVTAGRVEVRRGVQIVVAVTVGMTVFLAVFSRTYIAPYATPTGQAALGVVIGIFAVGFGWLRRLSGMTPVAPFLARPDQTPNPKDTALVVALTTPPTNPPSQRVSHRKGVRR